MYSEYPENLEKYAKVQLVSPREMISKKRKEKKQDSKNRTLADSRAVS